MGSDGVRYGTAASYGILSIGSELEWGPMASDKAVAVCRQCSASEVVTSLLDAEYQRVWQ